MNKTRMERHEPMTFINRGGKHASGADEQNLNRIPAESTMRPRGDRAYGLAGLEPERTKPARAAIGPAGRDKKSPATRSSRV